MVARIDATEPGAIAADTVTSGFPSLDRMLGGGFRRKDLVILAGDVGSGKSALALGIAIRAARAGVQTLFLSGEMGPERVMERALALEGKASVDDLRQGRIDATTRASVGAAALRLRDVPLMLRALFGRGFAEVREALDIVPPRGTGGGGLAPAHPATATAARLEERVRSAVRALKALAVERDVAVLALAQLPRHRARTRRIPAPRWTTSGGSVRSSRMPTWCWRSIVRRCTGPAREWRARPS